MNNTSTNIIRTTLKNNGIASIGPQTHPFTNVSSLGSFLYDNYICNPINILFLPWHIIKFLWYITFYNLYYRLDDNIKIAIWGFGQDIHLFFKNNSSLVIFCSVIFIVILTVILIINSYVSRKDLLLKKFLSNSISTDNLNLITEHPEWNKWKEHGLKDFYISSSSYSWMLDSQFCSKDAIKHLLQDYNVRFLELEILKSSIYSTVPIVASGIEEGQWITSRNVDILSGIDRSGFTFNECCNIINLYGFPNPKNNNPLFIKLILKNGADNIVLDKIAGILSFYFDTKLLSNTYSDYKFSKNQDNIPNLKMKELLDTVIIISNNKAKSSSKLYELVNINIDESESFYTETYEDFMNIDHLNDILTDNKCTNNICFRNKSALSHIRMNIDKNFDPSVLWYQGYQFVGMNFSIPDKHIKTNNEFFNNYITYSDDKKIIANKPGCSIILKPDILLENPVYVSKSYDSLGEDAKSKYMLNESVSILLKT